MEGWLYTLIFLSSFGGIALIIFYKFHKAFGITFFFHSAIYVGITVWESSIWGPPPTVFGAWDWVWGFWGLTMMFLIPLTFLTMFVYAQSQRADYQMFGRKETIEASLLLMLLIGNFATFGALEDFGCYIIWGLDQFYVHAPYFHGTNMFLGIPNLYWMLLPLGLTLQILSLWLIRLWRKRMAPED